MNICVIFYLGRWRTAFNCYGNCSLFVEQCFVTSLYSMVYQFSFSSRDGISISNIIPTKDVIWVWSIVRCIVIITHFSQLNLIGQNLGCEWSIIFRKFYSLGVLSNTTYKYYEDNSYFLQLQLFDIENDDLYISSKKFRFRMEVIYNLCRNDRFSVFEALFQVVSMNDEILASLGRLFEEVPKKKRNPNIFLSISL